MRRVEGPTVGSDNDLGNQISSDINTQESNTPTRTPSTTRIVVLVGYENQQTVTQITSTSNEQLVITEGTQEAILAGGDDLRSSVVNIRLVDVNGNSIQPESSLSICLDSQSSNQDDLCLGSFDEETGKWQCDDHCLEEDSDGQLCGDVDHLTNFALLLSGGNGGGSGCGSSINGYILGSAFNDLMLIMSVTIACCIISILLVILLSTSQGRDFALGDYAIRKTRNSESCVIVEHS